MTHCRGQVRLKYRNKNQENFLDTLSSVKPEMGVMKDQLLNSKVPQSTHSILQQLGRCNDLQ